MRHPFVLSCVVPLALVVAACADRDAEPASDPDEISPAAAAAVPATGRVIEIQAITDERGNRFEPADVEARPGDVVRVTLVSGVHNLSFPPDRNPGVAGLPEPSPMLQLPGQTHDIPIALEPGEYTFQCDPHAALGMIGTLDVEDDD